MSIPFVVVLTPPAPVVTVDEAKAHLRVDHTDDDAYIAGLIDTAFGWIDGPTGWLIRAIGVQTLQLNQSAFPATATGFPLIYGPVIGVDAVEYTDLDGAAQTMPATDYRLVASCSVWPTTDAGWPQVKADQPDAVRVTYRAGYPDTTDTPPKSTVPAGIRHAILLLVGEWYEKREPVGKDDQRDLPFAVNSLLFPFRNEVL